MTTEDVEVTQLFQGGKGFVHLVDSRVSDGEVCNDGIVIDDGPNSFQQTVQIDFSEVRHAEEHLTQKGADLIIKEII